MPLVPIIIAVISVIGVVVLLALPDKQPPTETPSNPPLVTATTEKVPHILPATRTAAYSNGTYTANAWYFTPKRVKHEISVTLAIQDNTIASADVRYDGGEAKTPSHQGFNDAYKPLTVGIAVDDLDLSRVGGASLTTTAFNEALTDIKSDASLRHTN